MNISMSFCVVAQPVEIRKPVRAWSFVAPMALRTWEGWTVPLEQAEPLDMAMPSRSSAIRAVSARRPWMEKKVVLATRGAFWPWIVDGLFVTIQSSRALCISLRCFV